MLPHALLAALTVVLGGQAATDNSTATKSGTAIAPAAASASSAQTASLAPQNVIDSSGLSEKPAGNGTWVHHANAYRDKGVQRGTMWSSGEVDKKRDTQPTITFDLGKPQAVGSFRVWNYNEANWTGNGFKDVEVSASVDGEKYAPLGTAVFAEAPGDDGYPGQLISLKEPVQARYVRLHCLSHWNGERAGLAEIRFYTEGAGGKDAIAPGVKPVILSGVEPNVPNPPRPALAGAENIVFPLNSGVIDVTGAPYHAKGDGKADDTDAIQQALRDYPAKGAIVYLPNGTYLISKPLRWGKDQRLTVLQGQSRAGTIIKLKDACPGYDNPAEPQEMVWTGGKPAQRFRNQIRNCTFNTGKGNPGAIGARFDASNVGCFRDVDIVAGDGQGVIGLDMSYADDFGPCCAKNIRVVGFDVGIATKHGVNGVVFESISLKKQRKYGWVNDGQPITVRNLLSDNTVPAIRQEKWGGFFTLIEANLSGGAKTNAAIELAAGGMFVRNVLVQGYANAIQREGQKAETVPGPVVKEWASAKLPGSGPTSLNLAVMETPELGWDDLKDWAVITDFGAKVDGKTDDSDALQRAIDSGKMTVCLPRGTVVLKKPIILRGNVRRLIGCETFLKFPEAFPAGANIFTVGESPEPVLAVERLACWFWDNQSRANFIDNPTKRTLVLRELADVDDTNDRFPNGKGTVISGPGDLFVEDVTGRFHLKPGVKAWMRYVNPETNQDHRNTKPEGQWHIKNEGAHLWILGIKTEGPGTVITTSHGGQTELLGGLVYSSGGARTQDLPMFVVNDAQAGFSVTEANFSNNAYKALIVVRKKGQPIFELNRGQTPGGGGGSMIPLWSTP